MRAVTLSWASAIALSCAPAAAPRAEPTVIAAVEAAPPVPPAGAAGAGPAADNEFDLDFERWDGVAALCHPTEVLDEQKGCVAGPETPPLRCGSERDARTSCSCKASDLQCLMRCARPPRKRFPRWDAPAPRAEHDDCRTQCNEGHAPSCLRLGVTYLQVAADRNLPAGLDLIERSCRLGYRPACVELFHAYRWVPEARGRAFAAKLEARLCDADEADLIACLQAAEAQREGWGVARDPARAAVFRERACSRVRARCAQRPHVGQDAGARERALKSCVNEYPGCRPDPSVTAP